MIQHDTVEELDNTVGLKYKDQANARRTSHNSNYAVRYRFVRDYIQHDTLVALFNRPWNDAPDYTVKTNHTRSCSRWEVVPPNKKRTLLVSLNTSVKGR